MSLLLAVVKKLEAYFDAKEQSQRLSDAKLSLSNEVLDLERKVTATKERIYSGKQPGWEAKWQTLEEVSYNLEKLKNLQTPPQSRKLEDKAKEFGNYAKNTAGLEKALSALNSEFDSLNNLTNVSEFRAVEDYVVDLLDANKESKGKRVNYSSVMKSFEEKHKGSGIAKRSKSARLVHFPYVMSNEKAIAQISSVFEKVEGNAPVYTSVPEGDWLEYKSKWKSDFNDDKIRVHAQYNKLWRWLPRLKLDCTYIGNRVSPMQLVKAANRERKDEILSVKCFVTEKATKRIKDFIESFSSPNLVPYVYETDTKELIYNKTNPVAEVFSGYFDKNKLPPATVESVLRATANKDNIITMEALRSLKFSSKEIQKLGKNKYLWPNADGSYVLPSEDAILSHSYLGPGVTKNGIPSEI